MEGVELWEILYPHGQPLARFNSTSVIEHAALAVRLAQFPGQAAREIAQEDDLDMRMALAQPLKILQLQQVALDFRVRRHRSGAWSAIEQGHFAEGHAR